MSNPRRIGLSCCVLCSRGSALLRSTFFQSLTDWRTSLTYLTSILQLRITRSTDSEGPQHPQQFLVCTPGSVSMFLRLRGKIVSRSDAGSTSTLSESSAARLRQTFCLQTAFVRSTSNAAGRMAEMIELRPTNSAALVSYSRNIVRSNTDRPGDPLRPTNSAGNRRLERFGCGAFDVNMPQTESFRVDRSRVATVTQHDKCVYAPACKMLF